MEKTMKSDTSKSTILVISMGFLMLHFLFSWQWAAWVAFIIGLIGILSPFVSRKIEMVWMMMAQYMGRLIPGFLLSIVFFLFLFPISLLSKLFRKDQLMLSNKYKTYFFDINKEADKKSFERIW
jgi:hypothetical protein